MSVGSDRFGKSAMHLSLWGNVMDMREFLTNRSQISPAMVERYAGKYIAWSPDGKQIIAADDDPIQLVAAVKSAGYDPADCVLSSVPMPEEIVLGGGLDA